MKIILLQAVVIGCVFCLQLTNVKSAGLGNINPLLPNLKYQVADTTVQLFDGILPVKTSSIVQATLDDRILNADINNDGLTDAAVVLTVYYSGVGYFSRMVFLVLQDYKNGPFVTNGVDIGIATYQFDVFSMDKDNKKIIVGFMNRLPSQPKAVLPSVPTFITLAFSNKTLKIQSTNTVGKSCYPF